MALEIEAKIKVPDLQPIRQRLTEAGAKKRRVELETNIFFDTADSSLLASDQGLRIRQSRPAPPVSNAPALEAPPPSAGGYAPEHRAFSSQVSNAPALEDPRRSAGGYAPEHRALPSEVSNAPALEDTPRSAGGYAPEHRAFSSQVSNAPALEDPRRSAGGYAPEHRAFSSEVSNAPALEDTPRSAGGYAPEHRAFSSQVSNAPALEDPRRSAGGYAPEHRALPSEVSNAPALEVFTTVTFKGPRRQSKFKSREEIELTVDDAQAAEQLLSRLGMTRVVSFEKRRESWLLGDCEVELDQLPYIGSFVEIEGPSEESISRVSQQLRLAAEPMVRASYVAMLMTHLQETRQTNRTITFAEAKR